METLKRYRVYLHSTPSPAWTFYKGYVDVSAEDEADARQRAPRELQRTSFRDRPLDGWVIDRVEWTGDAHN